MLKNISKLTVVIKEKEISLLCDIDTTLDIIKEALFQYSKYIGQIEDNIMKAQEAAKKEEEEKNSESSNIVDMKQEDKPE